MSKIGYYRFKVEVTRDEDITFFVNGVESVVHKIKAVDACAGDRILKFLDANGQYRFFPFSRYYETKDNPRKIGSTNEFITNILTDQTNSKNLGYKNERRISMSAEVDEQQLTYVSQIYTSPRVYLYVGDLMDDSAKDWVEVEVSGDNTIKRRKARTGSVDLVVTLPEHFTIKMI